MATQESLQESIKQNIKRAQEGIMSEEQKTYGYDQIVKGIDEKVAKRAARLVDTSEYKRRQAPPGVKITPRAFGRDRRLPITNRFKGA